MAFYNSPKPTPGLILKFYHRCNFEQGNSR